MEITANDLTIVLPTFNEEKAIEPLIDELLQAWYSKILVVDGYSTDRIVDYPCETTELHNRGNACSVALV